MQAAVSDSEDEGERLPPGKLYPLLPPRAPPPVLDYGGLAVHTYEDGSVYAGDWVRGMRSGWGVFTTPDGVHYAGEWRTDHYDGLGIVRYASGNRYEGEFLADQRHGRGLFLWKTTVRTRTRSARTGPPRAATGVPALRALTPCARARRTTACGTWTSAPAWAATCGLTAPSMKGNGPTACSTAAGVTSGQTVRGATQQRGSAAAPRRVRLQRSRSVAVLSGRKYEGDFVSGHRSGDGIATSANGRKFRGGVWDNGTLVKEVKLILEKDSARNTMYPSARRLRRGSCACVAHAAPARSRAAGELRGASATALRRRAPHVAGACTACTRAHTRARSDCSLLLQTMPLYCMTAKKAAAVAETHAAKAFELRDGRRPSTMVIQAPRPPTPPPVEAPPAEAEADAEEEEQEGSSYIDEEEEEEEEKGEAEVEVGSSYIDEEEEEPEEESEPDSYAYADATTVTDSDAFRSSASESTSSSYDGRGSSSMTSNPLYSASSSGPASSSSLRPLPPRPRPLPRVQEESSAEEEEEEEAYEEEADEEYDDTDEEEEQADDEYEEEYADEEQEQEEESPSERPQTESSLSERPPTAPSETDEEERQRRARLLRRQALAREARVAELREQIKRDNQLMASDMP